MTFRLAILTFLLSIAASTAFADTPSFEKTEGKLYQDDETFTGTHESFHPSGSLKSRIDYLDGLKHGSCQTWHDNGQRSEQRRYVANRKHGEHRGWFADGSPRFILTFLNGVYHGKCQQWYSNGQMFTETNFAHGVEIGSQKAWEANGKLRANYVVRDGHRYGLIGSKLCLSTIE